MSNYAKVENTLVEEVVTQAAHDTFNSTVQALFTACPTNVTAGYTYANGTWTAPVAPPTPPVVYRQLTPMQFYLAFTPAERMAIKKSTDVNVEEFWATYQLAAQTNTPIDPNLVSVQEGLTYLSVTDVAGTTTPYILPARIVQ